jgi:hypothetical protein
MTEHRKLKITREYFVRDSGEAFKVEIEIDLEDIAQSLAARAIHAKGQKSTTLRGAIRCKVISRES